MKRRSIKQKNGFVLIELLVVIGIMGLMMALLYVNLGFFQKGKTVDEAANEIVRTLRLAQSKTLSSEGDSSFGVYFETDRFTLFKGAVFNPGAPDNEVHQLNSALKISEINLGGPSATVFERLTGALPTSGSVKLELVNASSTNKTIFVDASGAISLSSDVPSDANRIKDSRHTHVLYSQNTKTASTLALVFPNDSFTQNIDYRANLNADKSQFYWEGRVTVGGSVQVLKIHSHQLTDTSTLFCIHRDRRFNSKALNISLDGQNLIDYTANGTTTQGTSLWAGAPQWQ